MFLRASLDMIGTPGASSKGEGEASFDQRSGQALPVGELVVGLRRPDSDLSQQVQTRHPDLIQIVTLPSRLSC